MFDLQDRFHTFEISLCDGVTHRGEGLHTLGESPIRMTEDGQRRFGQLAPEGDRHVLSDGFRGGVWKS